MDRVPLCPPDPHHQSEGLVSTHGLGAVVRREIHIAIRSLEGKLASLHTVLNTRMDSMEGVLSNLMSKLRNWRTSSETMMAKSFG